MILAQRARAPAARTGTAMISEPLDPPTGAGSGLDVLPASPIGGTPRRTARDAAMFEWLVRLRWLAIGGVAVVLAIGGPVLHVLPRGSAAALTAVLAALAAYNAALHLLGPDRGWTWLTRVAGQITVDCVALALLVHFAGGIENPFLPLFVLHVVNANIVLAPRAASQVLLLEIALVAAILLGEGTGLTTHYCLRGNGAGCLATPVSLLSIGVFGGLSLTLAASAFFARHLTFRLHESERRLSVAFRDLSAEQQHLAHTRTLIEVERSRLRSVIDCMGDAVTFSDVDGRLELANDRARQIQRTATAIDRWPAEPEAARAGEPGLARASTLPQYDRDGRTYEATRAVVRDPEGEAIGTVTVERDITDRLALERQLMQEERMSVVGKLAATVAHEINNPIGVVSLYAQHALAGLPPGSAIESHLQVIRRNADGCRKIIGDLLRLARTRQPARTTVDLRDLCHEVAQAVTPMAAQNAVQLVDESASPDAAPLWIEGDAGEIYQAALNLAVNAIEACAAGDRVSLGTYMAVENGTASGVIEVADSGPGIPIDQREQIFHPFFSTKSEGTGLGLAIADTIVRSHGGRIGVEPAVPRGTVFRIHLPCAARQSAARNGGGGVQNTDTDA